MESLVPLQGPGRVEGDQALWLPGPTGFGDLLVTEKSRVLKRPQDSPHSLQNFMASGGPGRHHLVHIRVARTTRFPLHSVSSVKTSSEATATGPPGTALEPQVSRQFPAFTMAPGSSHPPTGM